jgi:ectoine hydroxylase
MGSGDHVSGPLTPAQVAAYERDGFVILPSLFEDGLEELRAEADRLLAMAVNSSVALGEKHPRVDLAVVEGGVNIRKLQPVNDLSEVIAAVSADERLIAPMRQLMGDEPVLMEEKLDYKQVVRTDADLTFLQASVPDDHFPLHHDWGYYRAQGYPENTVSSAVAMDETAGRGPIRIIPGSHRDEAPLRNPDPASGDGVVEDGFYAMTDLVPVEVPAGSVMLFHAKLVHDSEPNTSGLPRRLMIYSHYPASHGGDPDRRNGGWRLHAQAFEQRYYDAVASGSFTDVVEVGS